MISDVCLVLEGTYPYIVGGVSSCVYQLISNTPQIKYSILFIGARKDQYIEYKYPIPNNVVQIKEIFLMDYDLNDQEIELNIPFDWNLIYKLLEQIKNPSKDHIRDIYYKLFNPDTRLCDPMQLLQAKETWEILKQVYKNNLSHISPPFLDYFYTWRFTTFPMIQILSSDFPRAKMYHALSTGYAGLAAVAAKLKFNRPLFLTEHGIYTHEREIEIAQAEWVYNTDKDLKAKADASLFKRWWSSIFSFYGQLTYIYADEVSTLYYGNKEKQLQRGAIESKIKIIPNGINIEKLNPLNTFEQTVQYKKNIKNDSTLNICLIGRVVMIKDIKTFIKACKIVSNSNLKVHFYILGPVDEEPEYFEECQNLVTTLELGDLLTFTGKVQLKDYLPKMDVLVLSSISEGQPLVVLEGYTWAIPSVLTDVGACREIIEGLDEKDKSNGKSGEIVSFGDSKMIAKAIIEILSSPENYLKYSKTAYDRVRQVYPERKMLQSYLHTYEILMGVNEWPV